MHDELKAALQVWAFPEGDEASALLHGKRPKAYGADALEQAKVLVGVLVEHAKKQSDPQQCIADIHKMIDTCAEVLTSTTTSPAVDVPIEPRH